MIADALTHAALPGVVAAFVMAGYFEAWGWIEHEGGWTGERRDELGVLSSYVFLIGSEHPRLDPNYEVATAYWIPLQHLWNPANRTTIAWDEAGGLRFPGIAYEGKVIWGLTYRVLQSFAEALGEQ